MSIMTRGVISMPYKLAMHSEMNRRQFHSHAQVLLAERDQLFGQTEQLKAENKVLRKNADRYLCLRNSDEDIDFSLAESMEEIDALIDAAMADEPTVNFDMERMEKALAGERHALPQGLTKEQVGEHICATAKKLRGEGGTQSGRNMAESLDTEGLKGGIQ
ncbi:hypothetical protein [Pseudomonas fluorescens]|uniref:hypothetical protein n=1 Tax=Pseudomonas fluorescens TaxID=294 RepID=UPI003D1A866E